jgi:hypothetical protein
MRCRECNDKGTATWQEGGDRTTATGQEAQRDKKLTSYTTELHTRILFIELYVWKLSSQAQKSDVAVSSMGRGTSTMLRDRVAGSGISLQKS